MVAVAVTIVVEIAVVVVVMVAVVMSVGGRGITSIILTQKFHLGTLSLKL